MPLNRFLRPPNSAYMLPPQDNPDRPQQYELAYIPLVQILTATDAAALQAQTNQWIADLQLTSNIAQKYFIRNIDYQTAGAKPGDMTFSVLIHYEQWNAE